MTQTTAITAYLIQ